MVEQKVIGVSPKYPHQVTVESRKGKQYKATPLNVPGFADHVRYCWEHKTLETVEVEWRKGEPIVTKLYNTDTICSELSLEEQKMEYADLGGDY